MKIDLLRFVEAHERDFQRALTEIKAGKKSSHWMWYIFPQLQGLGLSETSKYYAIRDLAEAEVFLNHPVLGQNLVNICTQLLQLSTHDPTAVFGKPDDRKLQSSMTLFSLLPGSNAVFKDVISKYFGGQADAKTLQLLDLDAPEYKQHV